MLGFVRTLHRLRETEGGDESEDTELAQHLATSYFHHRDRDPALFDDTLPCLEALRARYRLGLLSNGSRLPETVGLGGYFESVVFAQDHRVAKPEQGIFEIVEREMAVSPSGCVLVGDHPFHDVVGAKRAGWWAVWLDRDGDGTFDPVEEGDRSQPDAAITSLADLSDVLEQFEAMFRT